MNNQWISNKMSLYLKNKFTNKIIKRRRIKRNNKYLQANLSQAMMIKNNKISFKILIN